MRARTRAGPNWPKVSLRTAMALLDIAGIVLVLAVVAQVADPDLLLHAVWIVLALEAFVGGLRAILIRVVLASGFVLVYALAADSDSSPYAATLMNLDLDEWPLMAVSAIIVAIMADRERVIAGLYREASARLLTAHEDERRELAVDLHDGVGQTMTALALLLDAAADRLVEATSGNERVDRAAVDAHERIVDARRLVDVSLDEVRTVAHGLRPARLRENGLVAALAELSSTAGVPVQFTVEGVPDDQHLLDAETEVAIYRIVQEALGNAARHAQTDRISVTVQVTASGLHVEVADDGVGFDVERRGASGLGIASMRERAAAVGADLEIDSRRGSGTLVRVSMPLAPEPTADADASPSTVATGGPG